MAEHRAVRYVKEVWHDLLSASQWYEARRDGLGSEFETEFFDAVERVCSAPEAYAADSTGYKACRLRRFNAVMYFRLEGEQLLVIGLLVGGRQANSLRGRGQ